MEPPNDDAGPVDQVVIASDEDDDANDDDDDVVAGDDIPAGQRTPIAQGWDENGMPLFHGDGGLPLHDDSDEERERIPRGPYFMHDRFGAESATPGPSTALHEQAWTWQRQQRSARDCRKLQQRLQHGDSAGDLSSRRGQWMSGASRVKVEGCEWCMLMGCVGLTGTQHLLAMLCELDLDERNIT